MPGTSDQLVIRACLVRLDFAKVRGLSIAYTNRSVGAYLSGCNVIIICDNYHEEQLEGSPIRSRLCRNYTAHSHATKMEINPLLKSAV